MLVLVGVLETSIGETSVGETTNWGAAIEERSHAGFSVTRVKDGSVLNTVRFVLELEAIGRDDTPISVANRSQYLVAIHCP